IWSGATTASKEDTRLDFKQDARSKKESMRVALDAVLCLANTVGGHVIFGVEDHAAGPAAFVGSGLDSTEVRKYVHDNSRPHLLVEADEVSYRAVRLLAISVQTDHDIYSDVKGRAPHRIDTDCVGMDPATQQRLREERRGFDPSAVPARSLDVDAVAMARARERLGASLRPIRNGLAKLSDSDLLKALGVADADGRLLDAGHRLVGTDGTALVYQYRESPGGEPRVIERLTGPLLSVYDQVMDLIRLRRQLTPVTLPDGQQLQVEDFPELAVREAVGNALMHRDYRIETPVVVEHSPSVLVVTSPGPLVAGVTVDNILTHPSKPRNRALTAAVRTLELAEEVGRGVDRMYREMIRSGKPTPTIDATFDQVRVALVGGAPDVHIARYVAQLDPTVRDDTDAMIILLRLCAKRTVTARTVAPLLQKSVDEAEASLRHLATQSVAMIEPTRDTARAKHPNYRLRETVVKQLGTVLPYARHTSDEIDRRVVAHVQEYGRITNATVRNLFNVGTQRANQILVSLVERRILTKTSEAQRGPSVEYGPGAQFPKKSTRRRAPRR
ncbi:ATP-binding protein, partial [Phytoactinopolyspora endophytica]|uniref:ATP-binding protein n=1 Tax=Phytoactinopolyspora endophytica TaxID=1642495 RepID=UPI00101BAD43